jgi:putative aldouronate transport system permease protein
MIRKQGFLHELKKNKILFLMIVPAIVFFLINSYSPMVGIYFAFTKYTFDGGLFGSPFVGLDNFQFLMKSGKLKQLTINTIGYNFSFIVLGHSLAIFIAVMLNEVRSKFYKKFTQSIMFLPYFVSFVILNVIAYNLFNYEFGFLNANLSSLGLEPIDVYNTPWMWVVLIPVFYLWRFLGYFSIIYLAAIAGISEEYYEAARIDGANAFQRIRFITVPLLKPTFIILFLFSLGSILRGQFELFYQLVGSNSMVWSTTDIIDTYVFRTLRVTFAIGLGTAAGLYQSLFGFILILTVNWIVRKVDHENALF